MNDWLAHRIIAHHLVATWAREGTRVPDELMGLPVEDLMASIDLTMEAAPFPTDQSFKLAMGYLTNPARAGKE